MSSSRTPMARAKWPAAESKVKLMLLLVLCGAGACASSRSGSKPVPTHAIEVAADTKVPDAGDAAAPRDSAGAPLPTK